MFILIFFSVDIFLEFVSLLFSHSVTDFSLVSTSTILLLSLKLWLHWSHVLLFPEWLQVMLLFWHSYSCNLLYSQKCPILYRKLWDHPFHDIHGGETCGHSSDLIFTDFQQRFTLLIVCSFCGPKLFSASPVDVGVFWHFVLVFLLFSLFPYFLKSYCKVLFLPSAYTCLLMQLVYSENSYTNWIFWKLSIWWYHW